MKKLSVFAFVMIMVFSAQSQNWNFEIERTIKNVKGTVKFLGDEKTIIIAPDDNPNGRYISQQVPEEYKKDGVKITFSGNVGKIPPNYRMLGTPLKLKCICISKAEQKKFKLLKRKYVFK